MGKRLIERKEQDEEPGKTLLALAEEIVSGEDEMIESTQRLYEECKTLVDQLSKSDDVIPDLSLSLAKIAPQARIAVLTTEATLRGANDRLEPLREMNGALSGRSSGGEEGSDPPRYFVRLRRTLRRIAG